MLTTEDEAKTKLCQERFAALDYTKPVNRRHIECDGSDCMAWRWHAWTEYERVPGDEKAFISGPHISTTRGYCGKAGRPQGYGADESGG